MSVLSPEADMLIFGIDVCFAPKAVIGSKVPVGPLHHGLSPLLRDLRVILFEH